MMQEVERRSGAGDRRPPYDSDRRGAKWYSHLASAWQAYTALVLLMGAIAAFAGLPSRVQALESKQDEQNRLLRFVVCTMGAEGRNYDPSACESHLDADLLTYLRPRSP